VKRVLFAGDVHVDYHQIYIRGGSTFPTDAMVDNFAGQVNGLCGGAWPGMLFLSIGMNVGLVGVAVELHDEAPPLDDFWEDVVEVSFAPEDGTATLTEWGGEPVASLELNATNLRVRYCAHGLDDGAAATGRISPDEPVVDRYLLQFWPATPSVDRVVRQTSANAASHHDWVRRLPPPPTAEEKAETERQAEAAAREQEDRWEVDVYWNGVRPSERLRSLPASTTALGGLDRPLLDALGEADPDVLRAIAHWATRQAFDHSGLSALDWVAPALAALERREPLPAPFHDEAQVWGRLLGPDLIVKAVNRSLRDVDDEPLAINLRAAALPAILAAVDPDPLKAAVDALWSAAIAFEADYPRLFSDLRRAFPVLR
jgi:hypothetical protein